MEGWKVLSGTCIFASKCVTPQNTTNQINIPIRDTRFIHTVQKERHKVHNRATSTKFPRKRTAFRTIYQMRKQLLWWNYTLSRGHIPDSSLSQVVRVTRKNRQSRWRQGYLHNRGLSTHATHFSMGGRNSHFYQAGPPYVATTLASTMTLVRSPE